MKILVTGATGFLGRALCPVLEAQGHEVIRLNSKNGDLTRPDSLNAFNDRKYDHIYHLAAWTQAGDFCLTHPGEQWIVNQSMNTHVLAWWQKHQPQAKLISMGSSCVYDPNLPLSEKNYLVGTPIDSLFTYAMTKRMLEMEWAMSVETAIEAEAVAQALCMQTEDFARAFRAFAAKQKPVFEGN